MGIARRSFSETHVFVLVHAYQIDLDITFKD